MATGLTAPRRRRKSTPAFERVYNEVYEDERKRHSPARSRYIAEATAGQIAVAQHRRKNPSIPQQVGALGRHRSEELSLKRIPWYGWLIGAGIGLAAAVMWQEKKAADAAAASAQQIPLYGTAASGFDANI